LTLLIKWVNVFGGLLPTQRGGNRVGKLAGQGALTITMAHPTASMFIIDLEVQMN